MISDMSSKQSSNRSGVFVIGILLHLLFAISLNWNAAVYSKEEDVGTFTIKAVDDPRTLNKILYLRPSTNTISTNDLVALWEAKIGKTLEKVYLSEEEVLKLLQDTPFPRNYMVSIYHTIYVKGDQTNFEIGPDGVEASQLYPDVKYTTVQEYIGGFL